MATRVVNRSEQEVEALSGLRMPFHSADNRRHWAAKNRFDSPFDLRQESELFVHQNSLWTLCLLRGENRNVNQLEREMARLGENDIRLEIVAPDFNWKNGD